MGCGEPGYLLRGGRHRVWDDESVYDPPDALDAAVTSYCPGCIHGTAHKLVSEFPDETGIQSTPRILTPAGFRTVGNLHPNAVTVDAACVGSPGPVEYRAYHLQTGKILFQQGPFPEGTNNVGNSWQLSTPWPIFKTCKVTPRSIQTQKTRGCGFVSKDAGQTFYELPELWPYSSA